jgi:formate hydrogenlyase subunit 3/multisubunit Na+/H+ antiporter MnhD subunit
MGRTLIVLGIIFLVTGLLLTFTDVFSTLRLGRLPGDISIKRDDFSFYFPITTCLVISLVLAVIFHLVGKLR